LNNFLNIFPTKGREAGLHENSTNFYLTLPLICSNSKHFLYSFCLPMDRKLSPNFCVQVSRGDRKLKIRKLKYIYSPSAVFNNHQGNYFQVIDFLSLKMFWEYNNWLPDSTAQCLVTFYSNCWLVKVFNNIKIIFGPEYVRSDKKRKWDT
jgi:hypothetical protein